MVFKNAVSKLRNLASRRTKQQDNTISTETQSVRDDNQRTLVETPETDEETQVNTEISQRRGRKRARESESDEEIQAGDALKLMFNYFDKRFENIETQLLDQTKMPPTKKAKKEPEFEFKGKGNKRQYSFNIDIADDIDVAIQQIKNEDTPAALSTLNDSLTKIKKKNKIIKIVDRSEAGWALAEEYESDPVADDSDDCKRIRQAEQRAIKKRKTKITTRNLQQTSSFNRPTNNYQFRNATFGHGYTPQIIEPRTKIDFQSQNPYSYVNPFQQNTFRTPKINDVCLGCGEQGHWRKNCPKINNTPKSN